MKAEGKSFIPEIRDLKNTKKKQVECFLME